MPKIYREVSTDRLIKDVRRVLEHPFWISTLETDKVYARLHDDHDGTRKGTVEVIIDKMGDVFVTVANESQRNKMVHAPQHIRFRTHGGGGLSPRTRNALMILAEAIRLDNLEIPPGDPSKTETDLEG